MKEFEKIRGILLSHNVKELAEDRFKTEKYEIVLREKIVKIISDNGIYIKLHRSNIEKVKPYENGFTIITKADPKIKMYIKVKENE